MQEHDPFPLFQLPGTPVKARLVCSAVTFLGDRSRVTDRSIGSRMGHSVTAARKGPAVFIYHRKHHRRLKGTTKSTCRPPYATKNQSSLYRLQDRHQRLVSSSSSHSLSQLPPRCLTPRHITAGVPLLSFLSARTSLPLLAARISPYRPTPNLISEWRCESEWDARRKGQPVDCRSTWTIVKSRDATEMYVPRIIHVEVDEEDRSKEISREGLKLQCSS